MWRCNRLLKICGKIIVLVILMNFWTVIPVFGMQPMEQPPNLTYGSMRYYSDSEIDLLIDEIAQAAHEAIEQAAGEAARAAFLQSMEREAAAMREAASQQAEALQWRMEAERQQMEIQATRRAGRKNTMLAASIGILGGLVVGVAGTLALGSR